jgi:hypothetical protein
MTQAKRPATPRAVLAVLGLSTLLLTANATLMAQAPPSAPDKKPHADFGDPFNARSRVLDILNTTYVVREIAPGEAAVPPAWTGSSPSRSA